jgi:hypothetical protein
LKRLALVTRSDGYGGMCPAVDGTPTPKANSTDRAKSF